MPGRNFFLNNGDRDTTELSQRIRIGSVVAVDTDKATVTIDWLDKSGSRTEIPLSMPFCERGWGMFIMPKKYSIAVCMMRPYDFPVIIAYLPPNFMHPENHWLDYRQVSNLVPINSGEIVIRNLIDKAKCDECKNVYTLEEWGATYALDEISGYKMEQCPNPNCRIIVNGKSIRTPAVEYQNGEIKKVYKIQMGILVYLQGTGKLRIKMNDGLDATDTPDKGSLVDINLDDQGNFDIKGVKALTAAGQSINFNNGSNGVARKDDAVKVIIPAGTSIGITSDGKEVTATGNYPSSTKDVEITGTITAGSATVKAG